jgi:L-ascorbate metabolism protein UlaG (beta-lactamase superfamily)
MLHLHKPYNIIFILVKGADLLKVYYIHHSGFVVETESSFFIFDYFKNKKNDNQDFDFNSLLDEILSGRKEVFVFASHAHNDHYNSEILSWRMRSRKINYIMSSDIKIYENVDNCSIVSPYEELSLKGINIRTFGSTDEGVSFLVSADGKKIFFAGDLNWWKWSDDTKEEEANMEKAFKEILAKIEKLNVRIDAAFFPVDRRLEENYKAGGEYFIERLNPEIFIPMHFWKDYKATTDFMNYESNLGNATIVIEIHHPNEILI